MPPLPTGDMPVSHSSPEPVTGSDSLPDLSRLRKGWSKQFSDIDSLPVDTTSPRNKPSSKKVEALPELPSLGALASEAAMSMDDLDAFLTRYHQAESDEPSLESKAVLSSVPEMPTSSELPVSPPARKKAAIPELPTVPTPKIAMPQARDTVIAPTRPTEPQRSKQLKPDFSDLRNTAPQYCKFSPEKEDNLPNKERKNTRSVKDVSSYTDEDLREALQPIINPVVDQFLYTPSQGIHTYLEPMLRSTVRRAIAEQMDDSSPFQNVSGWDKFAWKLRALLSSRTYDDIVFDYTRRYQVEEVYLLRPHSRSLISYASHDPARHAKPEKVQGTVKKIASEESAHKDEETPWIKWKDTRNLMIRRGEHCILAAIVHGPSNAILRADLDYALRQAEERFGKALEEESDIHMQILQPLLEGCLLIQAPAIPN